MFRAIVKRHAITGSRLGRYAETRPATGFRRVLVGPGPSGTAHFTKRSGTCPVRCPFMFRSIVKRHAMTGSRLGRYAETGQPPGFGGDGWGPVREIFRRDSGWKC
ncbi:MAG: hypothetical protein Q7V05_13200 [Methanoregula sp.]|nr:hypothetical protein [Methanoregula sp.]